ncbi:unnamed protein product [Prorocentrum cordatum]|uniref:Uncharacterized protein n=1 Tax=Prorocentrum cordatum TaxID=2364126 RepID=A0ABN9W997_9DINO|nr:unnamed protein product [Polarella glacialis]
MGPHKGFKICFASIDVSQVQWSSLSFTMLIRILRESGARATVWKSIKAGLNDEALGQLRRWFESMPAENLPEEIHLSHNHISTPAFEAFVSTLETKRSELSRSVPAIWCQVDHNNVRQQVIQQLVDRGVICYVSAQEDRYHSCTVAVLAMPPLADASAPEIGRPIAQLGTPTPPPGSTVPPCLPKSSSQNNASVSSASPAVVRQLQQRCRNAVVPNVPAAPAHGFIGFAPPAIPMQWPNGLGSVPFVPSSPKAVAHGQRPLQPPMMMMMPATPFMPSTMMSGQHPLATAGHPASLWNEWCQRARDSLSVAATGGRQEAHSVTHCSTSGEESYLSNGASADASDIDLIDGVWISEYQQRISISSGVGVWEKDSRLIPTSCRPSQNPLVPESGSRWTFETAPAGTFSVNLGGIKRMARLSGGKLVWCDGAEWTRHATGGTTPVAQSTRDSVEVSVGKVVVRGPHGQKIVLNKGDDVARAIAADFHIPDDEQHLLLEHAPANASADTQYRVERKMPVQKIRGGGFTQNTIGHFFRDGRSIFALLNGLTSGDVDPLRDLEPIRISWHHEAWWSLDNRRLWALKCFSATHCQGQKVCVRVSVCPVTSEFNWKFSTTNNGASVQVIERSRSPSPSARSPRDSPQRKP